MKKLVVSLPLLSILILTAIIALSPYTHIPLTNTYNLANAQPGEDESEDDPPAYIKIYVYDGANNPVPGASVTVEVIGSGWVKVDDGNWFEGWGKQAETTTDSEGLAEFIVGRLFCFEMTIQITVNWVYPQTRTETISLGWCPIPTHTYEFYYEDHVIPELPFGTLTGLAAALLGTTIIISRRRNKN